MIFRWLTSSCWFSHEFIRDRDEQGRLILVCSQCQHQHRPELEREMLRGPAHTPVEPLGRATGKAVRAQWFVRRVG